MPYPKLLTAALLTSCLLNASAITPGISQTLTSPDQVPKGLSTSDWASIRSTYVAGVTSQQAYAKASNTGKGDLFGCSVAVSGDTVVVGASEEDSSTTGVNSMPNEAGSNSGAAYVFVRSGGAWSQQAYLKASNTGEDDLFGTSVAISGDTVVVGSEREDSSTAGVNTVPMTAEAYSGAAYVFVRNGGTWSQQAYLKASNTEEFDSFGISVAVSGDTVVVGAGNEDSNAVGVNSNQLNNNAIDSGAAYIFVRNGMTWTQQAYLKASNTGASAYFGNSVAVAGDTVVVGAFAEDSSATGVNSKPNQAAAFSGAAYVFARSNGRWSQQAYLKPSNTVVGDRFGTSVAVSSDTIAVGAPGENSSTTGVNSSSNQAAADSGAAFVFVRTGDSWSQQAYLKTLNTGANDNFGDSVAISGDTVVVGASQEDSSTTGINSSPNELASVSGAAYIFVRSGSIWKQQAYLKASNTGESDSFGASVAVAGGTIVAGAYLEESITTGVNSVPNDTGAAGNSGAAYIFILPATEIPLVVKYQINVKVNETKFGKVTGAGNFATGSSVTLRARPTKGRIFVGWYEKNRLITTKKLLVIKRLTRNHSLIVKFK